MRHPYLVLIFLVIGLFACKKIKTERPPCSDADVLIPIDTSYLSTPLIIPTHLIEDKLNLVIGRVLREDPDFEHINADGEKEGLKMKITRLGAIKVHWKNNVAQYQAPLQVLIERQIISKNVLPVLEKLALKTAFSLRLVFETTLDLGTDWQLIPKTRFVSFEWLSEVKALGGLIDIKKMMERRIYKSMPDVLRNMDDTIRNGIHIDRVMRRVWKKIQRPLLINRNAPLVWLKIHPIQFEMGKITTINGNLMVQGRLSATTETILGDTPVYTVLTRLPPLIKHPILPDTAFLYIRTEIPYDQINTVINENLDGKTFPVSGRRIKIKSAKIWGCGANLFLQLQVTGGIKGDVYFQGKPVYEPSTQTISIQNFDFEVHTAEVLLSSADWLLHSTFKAQMQTALSIPLQTQIVKIPDAILQGIENGRAGKKMDVQIDAWDFRPQKITVQPNALTALIIVHAKVRIELERLGKT